VVNVALKQIQSILSNATSIDIGAYQYAP